MRLDAEGLGHGDLLAADRGEALERGLNLVGGRGGSQDGVVGAVGDHEEPRRVGHLQIPPAANDGRGEGTGGGDRQRRQGGERPLCSQGEPTRRADHRRHRHIPRADALEALEGRSHILGRRAYGDRHAGAAVGDHDGAGAAGDREIDRFGEARRGRILDRDVLEILDREAAGGPGENVVFRHGDRHRAVEGEIGRDEPPHDGQRHRERRRGVERGLRGERLDPAEPDMPRGGGIPEGHVDLPGQRRLATDDPQAAARVAGRRHEGEVDARERRGGARLHLLDIDREVAGPGERDEAPGHDGRERAGGDRRAGAGAGQRGEADAETDIDGKRGCGLELRCLGGQSAKIQAEVGQPCAEGDIEVHGL